MMLNSFWIVRKKGTYRMVKEKKVEPEEKMLLIRLPKELHHQARLMAYELNVSMAQLCREGLELVLQKHSKKEERKKSK